MGIHIFDIFVLIVLFFATINGYRKGMVYSIAWLIAFFGSVIIANRMSGAMSPMLPWSERTNYVITYILLLIIASLVVWQFANYLITIINKLKLNAWNQQMGALVGFLSGVFICMVVVFVLMVMSDTTANFVNKSNSGPQLGVMVKKLIQLMPASHQDMIEQWLIRKDEMAAQLQQTQETLNGANQIKKTVTDFLNPNQNTTPIANQGQGANGSNHYPNTAGNQNSGQNYGGQNYGSQNYGSQNYESQNYGSQNYGSQNYGSQNYSGQNYGTQNYGGQNYGSQNYGSQNYGGQNYGTQNYGGQNYGTQGNGGLNYSNQNYNSQGYDNRNANRQTYNGSDYGPVPPQQSGYNQGYNQGYGNPGYNQNRGYGNNGGYNNGYNPNPVNNQYNGTYNP